MNDKNLLDLIPERTALLSNDDIKGLSFDDFSEFHRQHGDRFYGIRAKAITWNGSDCYIVYLSDETYEHEKRMKQEELLNLVPMGIGICELEENRLEQVYLNDSFYRLTGIPKHGNDAGFWDSVHPDDVSTIRAVAGRLSSGSNEDSVDFRIRCSGNEYRWFRMVMSVVRREDSKTLLYCSYVNIDDSVNSQEALKKANLELKKQYSQELSQRKMLEKDSMAAIQFNVTKDQLVSYRVNQGYLKEFGSGASGAVIRPDVAANIPTEEERRIAADFFDVNKAFSRFQQGIRQFSAEYRRRLNDGRLYWLRSICRLVQDEETGDLISYTYLQNVDTQRKKELVAQSVIDDGTDFVMLVNCVSETAILIRLRDHYQDSVWNLYSEFSFDLVRESDQWNSVAPDDRQAVREFFNIDAIVKNLENEPLATVFYKQIYPDQTVRLKKARAYYLDSVHEDIVIARRDITDIYEQEQKQKQILETALDEAQRASRAKSDFLSRMSHDLRTPMNVIIGLTSMALDRSDNSREMKETLSDITSSAKYLLSLINDCLDLEKITSGKMVLHPVPYPYEDFYNNVLAVIGPLCSQKNITFVLEEKTSKHPTIIADKMRMDQLLYNLLSNAVKFTPVGGKIEFLVENAHVEDGFNYFTCIVRDNGIGMSEEFQHHMYEAFSQEENKITPEYQGSGLGLAIVKQLADMMGATITMKSKLGEGTEFAVHFVLPISDDSTVIVPKPQPQSLGKLEGKRILLVEDHPLNAMIATKLLEKQGMTVMTASNGREALDKFNSLDEHCFDAILMDIRMPIMNGLDATRAIRALERPDAKTIPIIAMTANAFESDVNESLASGMNAHLSKPIDPAKLYETLAQFIKER